MNRIYFDNAASVKPCREALEAFNSCALQNYSNPAALHKGGIDAEKIINAAKKIILSKLPPSRNNQLIFTSGGTESNNLALFGVKSGKKRKIVTTAIEHPSVSEPLCELERRGFEVLRLTPPHNESGESFEKKIIDAVDENTFLLSIMAVNNETGFIIDTVNIYEVVKRKFPDCVIHTDAAQGFMKIPVNGDLISISAHKSGGLKGVGGLFIKDGLKLNPLIFGGGQQNSLRAGTEPTELIAAFGAAVENYKYNHLHFIRLSERLKQLLSGLDIVINSRDNIPDIINFSVRGIKSEILLHYFAENNIYVSSGSACARGKKSPSLLAFGVSDKDADSALRLSFSTENTIEEIDKFAGILKTAIERFKK